MSFLKKWSALAWLLLVLAILFLPVGRVDPFSTTGFPASDCFPEPGTLTGQLREMIESGQYAEEEIYQRYYHVLTDSLLHCLDKPSDHIGQILIWNSDWDALQKVQEEPWARLFRSVHFYWLSRTNRLILERVETDPDFKYSFEYRFAAKMMAADSFFLSTGKTNWEKLIQYLSEKRYAYILNRLWYGTGFLTKAAMIAALSVFVLLGAYLLKKYF